MSKVRPVERLWEDAKRVLLSNSGDILKLLIRNYNVNIICGRENTKLLVTTTSLVVFHNQPYKVISQMMIEREIDNRGSKSKDDCKTTPFVKEQRVDGS